LESIFIQSGEKTIEKKRKKSEGVSEFNEFVVVAAVTAASFSFQMVLLLLLLLLLLSWMMHACVIKGHVNVGPIFC
jgi:hypothetical protein